MHRMVDIKIIQLIVVRFLILRLKCIFISLLQDLQFLRTLSSGLGCEFIKNHAKIMPDFIKIIINNCDLIVDFELLLALKEPFLYI